jgi:hypothetical protein
MAQTISWGVEAFFLHTSCPFVNMLSKNAYCSMIQEKSPWKSTIICIIECSVISFFAIICYLSLLRHRPHNHHPHQNRIIYQSQVRPTPPLAAFIESSTSPFGDGQMDEEELPVREWNSAQTIFLGDNCSAKTHVCTNHCPLLPPLSPEQNMIEDTDKQFTNIPQMPIEETSHEQPTITSLHQCAGRKTNGIENMRNRRRRQVGMGEMRAITKDDKHVYVLLDGTRLGRPPKQKSDHL